MKNIIQACFDLEKDMICESLRIENKVVKTIINELYFPGMLPYEFSVIPVEILGSVYEQFLGKVIGITPAHHAKIRKNRRSGRPEVFIIHHNTSSIISYRTQSEG